jgi:anti-sigma factor (TIGR02949 family)
MPIDRYTCEHVFRLLDDYVDRELTADEIQRVQEHLAVCAACASEYEFDAETIRAVRARMQRIAMPSGLSDRIMTTLARLRHEAGASE